MRKETVDIDNSLHSLRPNGRLSQNPKTGGFSELFLPENDFKLVSQ